MSYTIEEKEKALLAAERVIEERTQEGKYLRGYNDCFAFVILYEKFLRGASSQAASLLNLDSYEDHHEFFSELNNLGFLSLQHFAETMKFEVVEDRVPLLGDVAYEERRGVGTAMVAGRDYWLTPTEAARGIVPRRRVLPKEIRPVLLVRPTYI